MARPKNGWEGLDLNQHNSSHDRASYQLKRPPRFLLSRGGWLYGCEKTIKTIRSGEEFDDGGDAT